MIAGRFGTKGQIYFDIDLVGDDGLILPAEVMLDTVFTEFLAINSQDADSLDWHFLRQNKLITAQGEAFFDIYLGRVKIDDQEYEIPVFAGEAIQEILLGSRWLKQSILVANYQQAQVTLG
ncbi:MAG: aspartyl protease [Microcystis panniformis Mp_MB_F_20051200_S9]|uniref:Aspartyl protease n=1 Tax=Microcystis panniformis Mp_MB_F_20051200_S9 TaxID=2486223 RepID=A0A552PZJ1_9CHRO|nr:MAG: aspartyl protease [Microcystis panniformis Mp_MB_F_20080800_S26D]TRV51684.1 MAG: aspartyl protease [Microcystis panniformis Mp_GB_SS_20050300_S99]TRV54028.1 MAG: aspartyl protease [Microcystis panniformis Mp_GB_SS_20050300_S99D]TRV57584.1 MAG: aspartyl protease [Microcystis panniformis Mp_MB_F_20080800_S26]TRV62377.1 MAG: aspartyl protease [Microcystis panniformis Mp_MB_F_20051200_S9]TRV65972.1 MAG: aspartyl protease [Microcystis panniformis Mp_MB_F_20051200_S9D]TRV74018.1 MAG: aspart